MYDKVENKEERKFTFDHAFWSHDKFVTSAEGYNAPDSSDKYTDQEKVWKYLGEGILEKAWKGLNCTAFAYGQTGAGKSYSFFGYGANKGIIPMACTKIFERIAGNSNPEESFEVTLQMVEIYMEKILDLLVDPAKRAGALEVRQTKDQVWVDGAVKAPCSNYD